MMAILRLGSGWHLELLFLCGALFRGGEVVLHEHVEFFVLDFVHHREFIENPAELFVGLDGDVAVLAEHLELQEAAVPTVRELEVFEQARMFLADGELVRKRINGWVDVRVAEVQEPVACVGRVLRELLGGEVFELFLDFGDGLAAGCSRERGELVQDALQKAEVPVLGRGPCASFPEACVALGGVGKIVECYRLRCEFGTAGRGGGDDFDGFAEEILCEELVECIVDCFFARNFKTGGVASLEFFDCCHSFSFFTFFLFKYTQKNGGMNVEIVFFCDVYRMFWGWNVAF